MDQVGERQDFDAELTRLGLRHEDFELYVRRANFNDAKKQRSSHYAVRVSNRATKKRNIYWGGPGQDWVTQFVAAIGRGLYGMLLPAPVRAPSPNDRRLSRTPPS